MTAEQREEYQSDGTDPRELGCYPSGQPVNKELTKGELLRRYPSQQWRQTAFKNNFGSSYQKQEGGE